MTAIAVLKKIQTLNLDYTSTDNKNLALIKDLPALRELSLDSANVNDESVDTLASMQNLRVLNLYHTLITEAGLKRLKAALPNCAIIWDENSALPNRRKT